MAALDRAHAREKDVAVSARRTILMQLGRALLCALLLPLALASTLPVFARAIAGRAPHVCHCDASHSTCACPFCQPDDERQTPAGEEISGRCGDEDVVYGARIGVAISAAGVRVVPASSTFARVAVGVETHPPSRIKSPPRRPPRLPA